MQRRQLAATVAAITMSVVSGVIAVGANTGTLGFAGGQPATPAPVTAPAPGSSAPASAATNPAPTQDTHREGQDGSGGTSASTREHQGGEQDD